MIGEKKSIHEYQVQTLWQTRNLFRKMNLSSIDGTIYDMNQTDRYLIQYFTEYFADAFVFSSTSNFIT